MTTQNEKAAAFRALHEQDEAFVIPNPWDAGTARMLAGLGFEALATTSAGYAFSLGCDDGRVGRDRMLEHVRLIVEATDLPVSADLENGFGDEPGTVAETVRLAADTGVAGGSIEDATGRRDDPVYPPGLAAERVRAACEAAHAREVPLTVTARAENFLYGRPDLDDTIRRLQAYQDAGADVLYAPGLKTREQIAAVVENVDRPVNVLAGLPDFRLSREDLSALGVKRISTGSALSRAALGAFLRATREMLRTGTFRFADEAAASADIVALFRP